MTSSTQRTGIGSALALALVLACQAPTLNIATEPIEIRIDLRHEVRVTLERDLSRALDAELEQGDVTTRSADPSISQRLADAKQAGAIGERSDGYLDVTPRSVAPADHSLVDQVNAERRSTYAGLASRTGAPQSEVELLAGATRLEAAEAGESIRAPDGEWLTKAADTHIEVVASSRAEEEGR